MLRFLFCCAAGLFSARRRAAGQRRLPLEQDLLLRAERLLQSGDMIPAGMTARVVLERRLLAMCAQRECLPRRQRGPAQLTQILHSHGYLDKEAARGLMHVITDANRLAHGHALPAEDVAEVVAGVRDFCCSFSTHQQEKEPCPPL